MTDDRRNDEDKQLELIIFGYIGEFPPIPDSFKAHTLALANWARYLDVPDSEVVAPLRDMVNNMHEQAQRWLFGDVIDKESEIN